ncbi:hypothetical protein GCM10009775_03590 [Microbacterium aoyamense]|uniref:Uncharacterized protein n=1 Tax=Microbacterium aoyamense TaxID=344166 RepID=A0ABP5AHF7_9MICO
MRLGPSPSEGVENADAAASTCYIRTALTTAAFWGPGTSDGARMEAIATRDPLSTGVSRCTRPRLRAGAITLE